MKSDLATKSVSNPNYKNFANRNGAKIGYVVPHHAAGTGTALAIAKYLAGSGYSAHYCVDGSGIVACVGEEHGSYANGHAGANKESVTFEMSNSGGAPNWEISAQTFANAAALTADILKRHGLGPAVLGKTVRLHKDFVATACPGPWFSAHAQEFCDRVNEIMGSPAKPAENAPQPPETPSPAAAPMRTLRSGHRGEDVKTVQRIVGASPDGIYGPKTIAAVKAWQGKNALVRDGVFGPKSRAKAVSLGLAA